MNRNSIARVNILGKQINYVVSEFVQCQHLAGHLKAFITVGNIISGRYEYSLWSGGY